MTPVLALSTRPAGSAGLTLYEFAVPPVLVGVSGVMDTPLVYTAVAFA
jgi:hypothetical protein